VRPDGIGADCHVDGTSSTDPDGSIAAYNWTATARPPRTGPTTSYPYPRNSTQTITLTVTDNLGATNSKSITFVVAPTQQPPTNQAPTANFTFNCVVRPDGIGADCIFNGSTSSDPDGTITSYVWTATARPSLSGVQVSYPYPRGNKPTITLTVTDNGGLTNTKTLQITVP
jgi:chitodextrinase